MNEKTITVDTHLNFAQTHVTEYVKVKGRATANTAGLVMLAAVVISCTKAVVLAIKNSQ